MISPRHRAPSNKSLLVAALGLALLSTLGCDDSPARMAGTIDMPKRDVGRPDVGRLAKEAKAKTSQASPAR
jgi:hypothetical protein